MGNESFEFYPGADESGPQPGPSWGNPRWPQVGGESEDDLTQALDPTAMKIAVEKAAKASAKALDPAAIEHAAMNSIKAMMLVRLYRVRGHLAANLDPLGLHARETPEDLTLEFHGFAGQEDTEVYVGGVLGLEWTTVGELYNTLRTTYCGAVGLEYMHIADTAERRFLQDKFESPGETIQFTPEGKRADQAWRRLGRSRDHLRHGASWPLERARQCDGQAIQSDLPRIFRRLCQSRRCRRIRRCEIPPRHQHRPRV